jgi:hypothetical protein
MDQLVVVNTITNKVDTKNILRSNDQEKNQVPETTYHEDTKTNSKEEHETREPATPRSQMDSNHVNSKPK